MGRNIERKFRVVVKLLDYYSIKRLFINLTNKFWNYSKIGRLSRKKYIFQNEILMLKRLSAFSDCKYVTNFMFPVPHPRSKFCEINVIITVAPINWRILNKWLYYFQMNKLIIFAIILFTVTSVDNLVDTFDYRPFY